MKGYVPTPAHLVDYMVGELFANKPPKACDRVLDPGCGSGEFIAGVLRWCGEREMLPPQLVGIEINPSLVAKARARFRNVLSVQIVHADYLATRVDDKYQYIIGNPPYVALTGIQQSKRDRYRERFVCARGRFDLYMLFFERGIDDLAKNGRLSFVTPEKYLYVDSATRLRALMASCDVESVELLAESTFENRTTYPAITGICKRARSMRTKMTLRDGTSRRANLSTDGSPWWHIIMDERLGGVGSQGSVVSLASCCLRISAGVATGADRVFVRLPSEIHQELQQFAYPAIAGRDLVISRYELPSATRVLLAPYDKDGVLLQERSLGALGTYLCEPVNLAALKARTCVVRKPWYAFHDNCPIPDMLRPKILCKDIGQRPRFWIDRTGTVLPLHSVYYLVPHNATNLEALCGWLNGPEATSWLQRHCQRAANGFVRLQSRVLQQLPVPMPVATSAERKAA